MYLYFLKNVVENGYFFYWWCEFVFGLIVLIEYGFKCFLECGFVWAFRLDFYLVVYILVVWIVKVGLCLQVYDKFQVQCCIVQGIVEVLGYVSCVYVCVVIVDVVDKYIEGVYVRSFCMNDIKIYGSVVFVYKKDGFLAVVGELSLCFVEEVELF